MNAKRTKRTNASRRIWITLVSIGLAMAWTMPGLAQTNRQAAKELSSAFSAAAKEAMPAVVSIKVEKTVDVGSLMGYSGQGGAYNDPYSPFGDDFLRKFFGGRMPQRQAPQKRYERGQGSGFIISKDGYILTNNHVVGDVDKITVELQDGRTFENAKLIGTDPASEVALIKIDGDNFPVLPMGNSERADIGDWVVAIGNPFGLSETVTVGVISAVGRSNVHIAAYEDFIQTDAAINPGNSGGPLVDLDGRVIGINTAIYSQSGGYMGIGFAIPINMARTIERQLRDHGKVTRGYLGIYGQDVTADMKDLLQLESDQGVIVASVEKGSPADKAGLESHDVLLEINGKKIESYDAFRNEIAMFAPNTSVRFLIMRNGKMRTISVTLAERPTEIAQSSPQQQPQSREALGLEVQNVTKDLAEQFGYSLGEGVIVTGVVSGSPAAEVGIQPGDLIQSVNRRSVKTVDEFERAVGKTKDNKVLLLIERGGISQFVVVRFAK